MAWIKNKSDPFGYSKKPPVISMEEMHRFQQNALVLQELINAQRKGPDEFSRVLKRINNNPSKQTYSQYALDCILGKNDSPRKNFLTEQTENKQCKRRR